MKLFLISDNTDTLMGMRLAGVAGVRAESREAAEAEIQRAVSNPEIGILLITERLATQCRTVLEERKLHHKRPLITEIPDRNSRGGIVSALERYVGEAVGIKLGE